MGKRKRKKISREFNIQPIKFGIIESVFNQFGEIREKRTERQEL